MAAAHIRTVVRRDRFIQLHVAEQSGTRVAPFEQIVAENAILGKPVAQGLFERVDIVDSLADERTLVEQILIDIGNRACIGVEAGLAATQLRVARAVGAGQTHRHARLEDAVSVYHAPAGRVVAWPVERVRHGAGKLPCRIARQQGIGIEGNHVFHVCQECHRAGDPRKVLA